MYDATKKTGRSLDSRNQVVLHGPSTTWVPVKSESAAAVIRPNPADEEDRSSVFSMSHYGPLDWDHSGDEFEQITVGPKISRRHSTLSELPPHMLWAFLPKSCLKSSAASRQARDSFGRFSKNPSNPSPSKSTPQSTIEPSLERDHRGKSSVVRSISRPLPERDHKGRFRSKSEPPPILPPKNNCSMSGGRPPSVQKPEKDCCATSEVKKIITKSKRVTAKSPYFTSASTPSKASKATFSEVEHEDLSIEGTLGGSFDSLPRTPRTPKTPKAGPSSKYSPKRPRTPAGTVSCIPFPPLSSSTFGLIQEKLANDPFRLLVAVTFLIRTHGKHAIPVFFELMERYPTPESLAAADKEEIVPIIRHLGLQNQRATTYQTYAQIWRADPPARGKRYAVRGYPTKSSGRNILKDEVLSDDDGREAWEIGHMTQGPYALDSWRIFCRDKLRGVAQGWNGEGTEGGFQPEWMRVVPEDKELRAFLRWMWLKEGFEWDPFTGEKEVAGENLIRAAIEGRIAWDDKGGMRVHDVPMDGTGVHREMVDAIEAAGVS